MGRVWQILGIMAFIVTVVFWIYVFSNRDSVDHADEFDDAAWSSAAEAVCVEHQTAIAELPSAASVDTPEQRAELVSQGTAMLEEMLAGLHALGLPSDPKGAETAPHWLDDYELYLQDRRDWTEVLRQGDDPPFTISGNAQGVRVTDLLETYAEVNAMPSCSPSPDA